MPHYVLQLDDESPDLFAVYSTIVDNLLTAPLTASEMLAHIKDNGYETWLKPYSAEQAVADWGEDWSDSMKQLMHDNARYYYWHEAGFCYTKLSDSYFCLPRDLWRWE